MKCAEDELASLYSPDILLSVINATLKDAVKKSASLVGLCGSNCSRNKTVPGT
jgi:hypothetical protein